MKIMSERNLLCANDLAYYTFRNKPSVRKKFQTVSNIRLSFAQEHRTADSAYSSHYFVANMTALIVETDATGK